jgi:hypothetical protein
VTDDRDPIIDRAIRELSALPQVNPAATARILAAVNAKESGDTASIAPDERARRTARRYSLGALGGLAAAAAIAGFAIGLEWTTRQPSAPAVAEAPRAPATTPATVQSVALSDEAPRVVPFVLRAPNAARVSLVGDFNGWDVTKNPLAQEAAPGVWSVTVSLTPGRHTYAFVVNDSVWTLDPRAARAADPDFGREGSVIVVGGR